MRAHLLFRCRYYLTPPPEYDGTPTSNCSEKTYKLLLAGFSAGVAWSAYGHIARMDKLSVLPNLVGLACNVVCFVFIIRYGRGRQTKTILAVIGGQVPIYYALCVFISPPTFFCQPLFWQFKCSGAGAAEVPVFRCGGDESLMMADREQDALVGSTEEGSHSLPHLLA